MPGAADGDEPAQAGDTGGAGEGRLLAGDSFLVGSTPAFSMANSATACAPAARPTNGTRI